METLERLAEMSEDDLYAEIGQHLRGQGVFPRPRARLIEMGMRWARERLAPAVCGNDALKTIASKEMSKQEAIMAVCSVLDVTSSLLGVVPAFTAAALIVRVGVDHFCEAIWESKSGDAPV